LGPRTGQGTVISNASSGTITITLNGTDVDSYAYGGSTVFYNAGQINVSGAGQTGFIEDPFINTGTLTVSSGTFGGTAGGTNLGTISVASGAVFSANVSGTYSFTNTGTMSGAGGLSMPNAGFLGLGGTVNLSGPWTFNTYGTIYCMGNVTAGSLNFISGTVMGAAPLNVSGPLNWSGGNIEGTVICQGGSVNVPASSVVGYGGTLINNGLMTWTPNSGPRTGGGAGTVISNAATGVINVAMNGNPFDSYAYGGSTAFYNAGQINVSGAGQTGTIADPFYNTGTLNIQSGTLDITTAADITNGTLAFGISNVTSCGQLSLPGPFGPCGALQAVSQGYTPHVGDTITLITYPSLETGYFSEFILPQEVEWQPIYGATAFSLEAVALSVPNSFVTIQPVPAVQTGGVPTFLVLGPIGSNYVVQASASLAKPEWTTFATYTSQNSSYYFTDPQQTNYEERFFRAVMH
jgi:hypothetical protein